MAHAEHDNDERIAKRTSKGEDRVNRQSTDRSVTEDRESTDSLRSLDRQAMLRDTNTLLPVPPRLPGYHLCWLTTDNKKDTIQQRMRLGYELVKPEEMPGFVLEGQKSGTVTEDRIQINEMVLAKISIELWLEDMKYLHLDQPRQSIRDLKDSMNIFQDGKGNNVAYTGGDFSEGVTEGFKALGKGAGKFTDFAGIN